MTREDTLNQALSCICGSREEDYGTPEDNFKVVAQFWEVYLKNRCVSTDGLVDICPEDIANMMALLKIARMATGKDTADNYVDLAGYAALGGEIATGMTMEE